MHVRIRKVQILMYFEWHKINHLWQKKRNYAFIVRVSKIQFLWVYVHILHQYHKSTHYKWIQFWYNTMGWFLGYQMGKYLGCNYTNKHPGNTKHQPHELFGHPNWGSHSNSCIWHNKLPFLWNGRGVKSKLSHKSVFKLRVTQGNSG